MHTACGYNTQAYYMPELQTKSRSVGQFSLKTSLFLTYILQNAHSGTHSEYKYFTKIYPPCHLTIYSRLLVYYIFSISLSHTHSLSTCTFYTLFIYSKIELLYSYTHAINMYVCTLHYTQYTRYAHKCLNNMDIQSQFK